MSKKITKPVPETPSFPTVPLDALSGWLCPKCGAVINPHVLSCPYCRLMPGATGLPPYTAQPQIFCQG